MIQRVKTATLGERPSYPKDERCLISLAALYQEAGFISPPFGLSGSQNCVETTEGLEKVRAPTSWLFGLF